MKNPSLRQEPRYEPASVIPLKQEASLIDWLKATRRLIPREERERILQTDEEADEFGDLIEEDAYEVEEEDIESLDD